VMETTVAKIAAGEALDSNVWGLGNITKTS
jgi:hypothetical protein